MTYVPFYDGGFKNLPDETTPVTAEFLNGVESELIELRGLHESQQAMLDAHAVTLATLATRAAPGLMDYDPAVTYHRGWPAIYAGSLYASRVDGNPHAPIAGAELPGPVSDPAHWSHNGVAAVTDGVVSLLDGATVNNAGPSVVELEAHDGLAGLTVEAELKLNDSQTSSTSRGLMLGILDGSKPVTAGGFYNANSGFYGVRITPLGWYVALNGSSSTLLAPASGGSGIFDWSRIGVTFEPLDDRTMVLIATRNGVEVGRANIATPAFDTFRVAAGSVVNAAGTSTLHQLRGTPTVGIQAPTWRRIGAVADD